MRFRQRHSRRLNRRAAALPLVALTVLTTFACSLDKLTQPKGPEAILDLTVAGDSTLSLGGVAAMSVTTPTGPLASSMAVVIWSSDQPAIAAVDATTGIVTGAGIGTATISAKVVAPEIGEISATAKTIRVKYAGIKITTVDSLIAIGVTKVIAVRGTNAAGTAIAPIPFSTAMQVVSRDPAIFEVNASGALVAKANGTARLFVEFEGLKDSLSVKVRQLARSITFPAAVANELAIQSLNKDRTLTIAASDSLGVAISAPTIAWSTSDAMVVSVGAATGVARGLKLGTARIRATVDGKVDSILTRVTQVTASLSKIAGDASTATVGTAVATVPRVAVLDSGNTPIPSVGVTFAVATGGGSVSGGTQTSAAITGQASPTSWTLGTVAGVNTLTATAGGITTTFSSTGTAGAATKLVYVTQPAGSVAGAVLAPVRVAVADANDNVITTASTTITLAVSSGPGTLGGTLTATAANGVATFSNLSLSTIGDYSLVASASSLTSVVSGIFAISGPPAKLAFSTQPTGTTVGQPIPSFRVLVQDANGTTVTGATNNITLSTTPAETLCGTTTVAAVNGVATFSNVTVPAQGTYTITATSTSLTATTSSSFTIVSIGPPTKLAFVTAPPNVQAGVAMANIQVAVQDANSATANSSSASVTLEIENNPGSATLSAGSLTVNAVNGIATFTSVSLNKTGAGYTLRAKSTGLTNGVSSAFNVSPGPASKLAFAGPIPNAVVSQAISPAIQVQVQDANGNVVTSSTASVSIAATGGGGGTLAGGGPVAAVAGVATFSNAVIGATGANYQLTANSTGLAQATSTAFSVVSATAPIKLGFIAQPSNVESGANMAQVQVAIQNASGATVSSTNTSITLTLTNNTTGAVMSGSTTQFTTNGIATFSNLRFTKVGTGYTLTATATSYTSAVSSSFNVTPGAVNKVAFLVQPPSTQTAGVPFATDLKVEVQDANGNFIPTATNNIDLFLNQNHSALKPSPTVTVAAVNGVATFPGVRVTKAATGYTLTGSISGVGGGVSSTFEITAAPPSALSFTVHPGSNQIIAGQVLSPSVQIQVSDSVGNLVSSATNDITVAISSGPTGAVLSGTATRPAVAGVATFADVSFNKSGSYEVIASATGLSSVIASFFVNAGPAAKLAFTTQPTNTFVNAPMNPGTVSVQVEVQDAAGNQVTSNAAITIAIGTNPTVGATLTGTLTSNANFGTMSVPGDVKITKAGTGFTLVASASGLTSATSAPFNVDAFGAAAKLVWLQHPANNVTSTVFRVPIQVAVADQYGNTVTSGPASSITIGCQQGCSQTGTTPSSSASGVATFANYTIGTAGTFNLFASTGSLFNDQVSSSFVIGAADVATSSGGTSLYDVAINGDNAFYIERHTTAGAVKQVSLTTGTTITLASDLANPAAIVTDGTNVYWIEDGSGLLKRVPVGGGPIVTMTAAMTGMQQALETDGTWLFFVTNNTGGAADGLPANTQRQIKQIAKNAVAGSTASPFYTASCGLVATCQPTFTISGPTMYYWRSQEGGIYSVPSTGGVNSTSLVTGVAQPGSIVVGNNTIFYTSGTTLLTAPATGGSGTSRGSQFSSTSTRLGFDGTTLYSLDTGISTIKKFSLTDFSSISLTTTTNTTTRALAFDTNFVFWADNATPPKLRRVAK